MKKNNFITRTAFFWFGVLIYSVGLITSFFSLFTNLFKRRVRS